MEWILQVRRSYSAMEDDFVDPCRCIVDEIVESLTDFEELNKLDLPQNFKVKVRDEYYRRQLMENPDLCLMVARVPCDRVVTIASQKYRRYFFGLTLNEIGAPKNGSYLYLLASETPKTSITLQPIIGENDSDIEIYD